MPVLDTLARIVVLEVGLLAKKERHPKAADTAAALFFLSAVNEFMDTHRDLIVLSGGVIILIIVCLLWLFAFLRVETVRTDIMIVE